MNCGKLFYLTKRIPNTFYCRYLLHIVLEAGYFEWAILLAIVLRDTAVLVHILSVARLSDISAEIISKLKVGITALQTWANVEW